MEKNITFDPLMANTKRLRMFAGPNGSGKTTVFNNLLGNYDFDLGIYLNADEIEKQFKVNKSLKLSDYRLPAKNGLRLKDFVHSHSLYEKATKDGYGINLKYEKSSILSFGTETNSYEASILTDFLRKELIKSGLKFSFETVMSHVSKIETFKLAKAHGFKNYLYFISTENPGINKLRVEERVLKGGHPVAENKIEERYYRSLQLLKEAIPLTYRTFIFDSSDNNAKLILDVYKRQIITIKSKKVPKWVDNYCLST